MRDMENLKENKILENEVKDTPEKDAPGFLGEENEEKGNEVAWENLRLPERILEAGEEKREEPKKKEKGGTEGVEVTEIYSKRADILEKEAKNVFEHEVELAQMLIKIERLKKILNFMLDPLGGVDKWLEKIGSNASFGYLKGVEDYQNFTEFFEFSGLDKNVIVKLLGKVKVKGFNSDKIKSIFSNFYDSRERYESGFEDLKRKKRILIEKIGGLMGELNEFGAVDGGKNDERVKEISKSIKILLDNLQKTRQNGQKPITLREKLKKQAEENLLML